MALRFLAVGVTIVAVFLAGAGSAGAKGRSYMLTGGELGDAGHVIGGIPDGAGGDWMPGLDGTLLETPAEPAGPAYDLYLRYGVLAMASQATFQGPALRYYPGLGLVHDVWADAWYQPPAEAVRYLDGAIKEALLAMERGELEDPFVADLRGRQMHEANYWLRPYSEGSVMPRAVMGQCEVCIGLVPDAEAFVFEDLVETLVAEPRYGAPAQPAYVIEFNAWFGQGGFGGFLGFYTPPSGGQAGRFWNDAGDARYFETTPGFDAAIAEALAGPDLGALPALAGSADDASSRTTLAGAGAALLVAMLGVGMVLGLARRRG